MIRKGEKGPAKRISVAAIAITVVIASFAIASAAPPVEPPTEGSVIETTTVIECVGDVTEVEDLDWIYSTMDLNDSLEGYEFCGASGWVWVGERLGGITYEEDLVAMDGFTQFTKDFKIDTTKDSNNNNLEVAKRIGYVEDKSSGISKLDFTENVGMCIILRGDSNRTNSVAGLCPFADGANNPTTCECVAAGGTMSVDVVSATTETKVDTTDSPMLHYGLTAKGIEGYGEYVDSVLEGAGAADGPYGVGTVAAGMDVEVLAGADPEHNFYRTPNYHYQWDWRHASTMRYSDMTTASGTFQFSKAMTYTPQNPEASRPSGYPVFP